MFLRISTIYRTANSVIFALAGVWTWARSLLPTSIPLWKSYTGTFTGAFALGLASEEVTVFKRLL